MAYKKDVNDCREFQHLISLSYLQTGAKVEYHDPYVPFLDLKNFNLKSIDKLDNQKIKKFDICVIITNHSSIDYDIILKNSKLIVDTRNVYKGVKSLNIKRIGQG